MDWLTALSVPLGVAAAFLLFRYWFPSEAAAGEAPPTPKEKRRYHRIHLLSTLALPVLALALLYPMALLLAGLHLGVDRGPDLVYAGLPGPLEWAVVCLLPSLGLSLLILERVTATLLKADLPGFRAFQSGVYGFDSSKVRSFLRTTTLVAGISILVLMLDYRVVIRRDKVLVDPFLTLLEEEYPVLEIDSVLTAPKVETRGGRVLESREYVLKMSDGRRLASTGLPGLQAAHRDSLFALIALLAGKPVTEKPVLERSDLR